MHILHNDVGDLVSTQEYLVGNRHFFSEHPFVIIFNLLLIVKLVNLELSLEITSFFGPG